jgi:hypothetical protein
MSATHVSVPDVAEGDVTRLRGGLDERRERFTRRRIDRSDTQLVAGVRSNVSCRTGVTGAHVRQQDMLPYSDSPGDCKTQLTRSDDDNHAGRIRS